MRAVQLVDWQRPLELREVPVPAPGPGEVLVRVCGAGLCHSDLHLMEWPAGMVPYDVPFTIGHENSGRVAALGDGVEGLAQDDAVLVHGPWGCGDCAHCARGMENICERAVERRGHGAGLGRDGGLAEYVLVPSSHLLVPLGDLEPVAAAPLTDAGLTPYHAIKSSLAHLGPGSTTVVVGVGGLGHVAVQMLRALTATRVIAVDPRPGAQALASKAGAAVVVDGGEDAVGSIRAETRGGLGADVVLDFVGVDGTAELAAAVAGVGSRIVMVGMGGGTYPMRFGASPLEATVVIPSWGTRAELLEVVSLARSGDIEVQVETVELDAVPAAYDRLRNGEVTGRIVAVP
jgi:propanol-preferring alcohol dehydrogenase